MPSPETDLFGQAVDDKTKPKKPAKQSPPQPQAVAGVLFTGPSRPYVAWKDSRDKWTTWLAHDGWPEA